MSEEEKQIYMMMHAMDFGYKEGQHPTEGGPPAQTPAAGSAHQGATSAASTSASSSSAATKDIKNKFDKKSGRQLMRRVSDEGSTRKNLTQEMEAAAMDELDEELIQAAQPPQPPAPTAPAAASDEDR